MDSSMVPGCGRDVKVIVMWDSGRWEKQMVTVFMFGLMEIGMKAILKFA
jgi:hypothetical protein